VRAAGREAARGVDYNPSSIRIPVPSRRAALRRGLSTLDFVLKLAPVVPDRVPTLVGSESARPRPLPPPAVHTRGEAIEQTQARGRSVVLVHRLGNGPSYCSTCSPRLRFKARSPTATVRSTISSQQLTQVVFDTASYFKEGHLPAADFFGVASNPEL